MTRSVVFDTPGHMDLRAITCIGVNTKPNSTNPIGFFGTGLKYSVAVLARERIPLVLVTLGDVYTFYRKTEKFRDKNFDFVRMKKEPQGGGRAQYSELTYTTEMGKKWELWQAFRELYSNTLDENGETYVVESLDELEFQPDRTYVIVTSDQFAAEYDRRHEYFLPDGLTLHQDGPTLQVLDRPSKYVYYRGMRVYDLDKPSRLTYNFLQGVELTEDRTAKNWWQLKTRIESHLLEHADADTVQAALLAEPGTLEAEELSYTYHSTAPSEAFAQGSRVQGATNRTAAGYVRSKRLREASAHPLAGRPRPWRVWGEYIVDADGDPVLKCQIPGGLEPVQLEYVMRLLANDLDRWDMDAFQEEHGHAPEEEELPVGRMAQVEWAQPSPVLDQENAPVPMDDVPF